MKKFIRYLLFNSGISAASSAICSATGAAVLAANGHEGHEPGQSAAIASSGSAAIAAMCITSTYPIWASRLERATQQGEALDVGDKLLETFIRVFLIEHFLGPLLGNAMLKPLYGDSISDGQYEADAAVGLSIFMLFYPFILAWVISYFRYYDIDEDFLELTEDLLVDQNILVEQNLLVEQKSEEISQNLLPKQNKKTFQARIDATDIKPQIPYGMECPVTLEVMDNPQIIGKCGHSVDQSVAGNLSKCPVCNGPKISHTIPNVDLKKVIESFVCMLEAKQSAKLTEQKSQPDAEQKTCVIDIPTTQDANINSVSSSLINNHLFKINIKIKDKIIEHEVSPATTITDLRNVYRQEDPLLPSGMLHFVTNEKVATDNQTMAELNIEENSTVTAQTVRCT